MTRSSTNLWYKGFGNTITILSFLSGVWPLSVIVMWYFSEWSNKSKIIITILVIILSAVALTGYYVGSGMPFHKIKQTILLTRKVINYGVLTSAMSLLFSLLLTIFSSEQDIDYRELWLKEGLILIVIGLLILFFAMISVGSIYS